VPKKGGEIKQMFRIKKAAGSDSQPTVVAERQEAVEEPPVTKLPPRRTLPMPVRPIGGPSFPETARRIDAPAGPLRADAAAARDKSLVIGKEVRLKGEISACEKMILDGDAEIALTGSRHLQIGASGCFRGTADVAEADVGGHFEGDLVARERLTVRPTGRIRGSVRYAQITIEAGGQITGEMTMLDAGATATGDPQLAPRTCIASGSEATIAAERP
jgi:cytoskeletal protein CcmA (bactofilin family)